MKILITAKFVSGSAYEGGSSRFFKTVADVLEDAGHEVVCSNDPEKHIKETYDLIICSHNSVLHHIRHNPAFKVCVSHGTTGAERLIQGADRYISVSDEVMEKNHSKGVYSDVIPQPINLGKCVRPQQYLTNILIIRREPVEEDPFDFLSDYFRVRYSDLEQPIEDQIAWADLCITLGRGALESMAQGKPVLIADNRAYIGAFGDGYVDSTNIDEIAKCNFSGRRFKYPVTQDWIMKELERYNADDSEFLYDYVSKNHNPIDIVNQYLDTEDPENTKPAWAKVAFGVLVNDMMRLDMVFQQSQLPPDTQAHTIKLPDTACKGLNKLLTIMEDEGDDIAVLCHQDMYFRAGWLDQMKQQILKLPDSWVVAGIIGKDEDGEMCGRVHDMRIPLHFSTDHTFPHPASCFDECCIIVNLKKGFRFNEDMPGFDLYGTLAVLQTIEEMDGSAWVIDAFAEHFCMRSFSWIPDKKFEECFKWLYEKFPKARRIDTTVIASDERENPGGRLNETRQMEKVV